MNYIREKNTPTPDNKVSQPAGKLKSMLNKFQNGSWFPVLRPGGNVLEKNTGTSRPVLDQTSVKMLEPFGTKAPQLNLQRASGWSQIQNLSHDFTIQKVQGALRAAERGDMTLLFGYYRDFFLGSGIVASSLSKRKLATISEPYSIMPVDKTNANDIKAAEVIKEILDHFPTFQQSLIHLMNAVVFPVAAVENIFKPIDDSYGDNKFNLRWQIKELSAVDYNLITYRLPYLPQGPINIGNQPVIPVPPLTQNLTGRPEDTIWDPDQWEPNLRFWSVFDNGLINYSYATMMAPDPDRHIIYRSNLLEGIARENFGALGKSVLWWTIMSQMGVDKFFQCLQRYGIPFVLARVDSAQTDTVQQLNDAFGQLNVLNSIMVNKDAIVELQQMNMADAASAHSQFLQFCNDQITLLINGETLSSNAKSTGLGSGVADLHGQVGSDFIKYDRLSLNNILRHGLFRQLLDINGIKGSTPNIVWGGSSSVQDNKDMSITLLNLSNAGFTVDDSSLDDLSIQFGFTITRAAVAPTDDKKSDSKDNNDNKNDNEEEDSDE